MQHKTIIGNLHRPEDIKKAAELLHVGETIIVYFNGTYAFLCDADQPAAGDRVFELKKRPRHKTLAMLSDPDYFDEFVDLDRLIYPLEKIYAIQRQLHALGILVPANTHAVPNYILQSNTVLNVWTEYPPLRPFRRLQVELRMRGGRAFMGASANMSGEPTYNTVTQVLNQFGGRIPMILDNDKRAPKLRRRSTSMVDFTQEPPTLVRAGNVTAAEINSAIQRNGLPSMAVSATLRTV